MVDFKFRSFEHKVIITRMTKSIGSYVGDDRARKVGCRSWQCAIFPVRLVFLEGTVERLKDFDLRRGIEMVEFAP